MQLIRNGAAIGALSWVAVIACGVQGGSSSSDSGSSGSRDRFFAFVWNSSTQTGSSSDIRNAPRGS